MNCKESITPISPLKILRLAYSVGVKFAFAAASLRIPSCFSVNLNSNLFILLFIFPNVKKIRVARIFHSQNLKFWARLFLTFVRTKTHLAVKTSQRAKIHFFCRFLHKGKDFFVAKKFVLLPVKKYVCMAASICILVLFVAFFVWLLCRRPYAMRKGDIGEKVTAKHLMRLPSDYVVLSDVLLPTDYGTTQIDHVVICPYGIFVIEVKNYNGNIFGSENSQYWTQNIYGHKYEFRNPLKQNLAHIYALKNVVNGLKKVPFYSIIAFGNQARLCLNIDSIDVIYINEIEKKIREYDVVYLDREEVLKYQFAINSANITDEEIRKNHVNNLKKHVLKRELDIANLRCPQCGGNLVARVGKYGQFYGCSNYPNCKFICK